MKLIKKLLARLFILGGLVALLNLLHAQEAETMATIQVQPLSLSGTDMPTLKTLSDAELSTFLNELDATPMISADAIPESGTFWSLQHPDWPPLPGNAIGAPVWQMQDSYLLDDVDYDYSAQASSTMTMGTMSLDVPSFDDSGTNGSGTNLFTFNGSMSVADYGTNLWIAQVAIATNHLTGVGSNTLADIQYEIQSRTNLAQTDWQSEGFILGSETNNWTPLSVAQGGRTNLFIRLRSWADNGSGLPIWWQTQNFGTNSVDPYADPDGDGWNNLQEFQNGTNPNSFNTPPAPQGLAVDYNANSGIATVTWLPSPGSVTGYTLHKEDWQTGLTTDVNLSAGTQSFTDDLSSETSIRYWTPQLYVFYSVQAHYASGNSAWALTRLDAIAGPVANLVNGPQGRLYFAIRGLPSDLSKVRIFRSWHYETDLEAIYDYSEYDLIDGLNSPLTDGIFEISATNITNGVFVLPDSQAPPFFVNDFWVQTVRSNGVASTWWHAQDYAVNNPLVDARSQLKDNLRFLLRSATELGPFAFQVQGSTFSQPTNCAYADFYSGGFDELRPVHDNVFYRNFVFDQNNLNPDGFLNTGCFWGGYFIGYNYSSYLYITNFPTYFFNPVDFLTTTNPTVPASFLTANQTTWILPTRGDDLGNVAAGDRNFYGLPYLSVKDAYVTNSQLYLGTYNPGDDVPDGICYRQTAQPGFQTAGYYFASVGRDPMPGQDGFSPASTTQPMIAAVNHYSGYDLTIAGYAKLAVTNGYSGVYGYLGQYFDKAFQIDNNGTVTTNTTGILSPYGNFHPTEPGAAALVTMPDIDTGERGTCIVHTVSLQLDANHDGSMTLPFSSSDVTTPANPMAVWANNNYDRGHAVDGSDFEQDDLGPVDIAKGNLVPDCQYTTNGLPAIPCTRDLEDYFRLWTPGLSAAISAMPTNYTVQLALYGDGAIRVFRASEASGGTNYLFDKTTASNQVANSTSLYVGLLSFDSPLVLNNRTNEYFIFCGVTNGSVTVELQILDGNGYIVTDAQAYLQINDIKQMYERWTVGEKPLVTPKSVADKVVDGVITAFQYTSPQDTNTPYILFVHGWNQETWEKDRYAETAFKRLYWQGYHGRFGSFRWPTDYDFGGIGDSWNNPITDPRNFDNSEFTAWQSATGLLNKLNALNSEYPDKVYILAHSMGNIVTGEALRLAGTNRVVNTYAALQGAIASHTYDSSTTTRTLDSSGINFDSGTPNRYANYYTNGAVSYLKNSAGAGVYVNFYNTNDYALGPLLWQFNQDLKPDDGISFPGYHYSSSSGFYRINGSITTYLNFPTNTYEIFAYCDEARCYAIGAQANVGGAFKPLTQFNQIELNVAPYNYGAAHKYHSGEFRSDNMSRGSFWRQVITTFDLQSP
jgi:hypothetical protein